MNARYSARLPISSARCIAERPSIRRASCFTAGPPGSRKAWLLTVETAGDELDCTRAAIARRREEGRLSLACRLDRTARQYLGDERRRVEDEADALVTELRRAGEAADLLQRLPERLDHDVLLTDEAIDDEADASIG